MHDFRRPGGARAGGRPRGVPLRGLLGDLELANGFTNLATWSSRQGRFDRTVPRESARAPDRKHNERFLGALVAGLPPCAAWRSASIGSDELRELPASTNVLAFAVERS